MEQRYIHSVEELRQLYALPSGRTIQKQLARLDRHCQAFIALSPFVVIATGSGSALDASPRGGAPGFVRVADDRTLWIPDAPGNNRLDSLVNLVTTGAVGLLFLIPGVDETLRVNGTARLSVDPELLRQAADERRTPKLVIEVTVAEAFLHCAKALMRSQLWSPEARVHRSVLPTMGEMLAEQTGSTDPIETQEEMLARYRDTL
jgi:PPOX class probable FMN-dependent enzyme